MSSPVFSDIHCSLGDGRSFTDPVSNWTLISGVDLDRDLANMLQAGRYPTHFLPEFLHEFLHHWCFHSPVGLALALLQLRARRRALLLTQDLSAFTTEACVPIVEDVARYETAITLLRPLTEGLALFAEFDAIPGNSRALSTAMAIAATSFTDLTSASAKETNGSLTALTNLLNARRLSTDFVNRKANLLVQPLRSQAGGYLPGYLTVKNVRHALFHQTKSERLLDSDFYMMYLRSFFYEDFGLVATLLDPNTWTNPWEAGPTDSVQGLSIYFQRRFSELATWTSDAELGRFEEAAISRQTPMERELELGTPLELASLGRQRLNALIEELQFDGDADNLDKRLRLNDQWFLAQRDLMCIGSFKAPVRVNEHNRALVGEYNASPADFRFPICALQALPDAPEAEGIGSLEVFLSSAGMYSLLTVWLQGRVVAIFPVGEGGQRMLEQFPQQMVQYRTSLEDAVQVRDLSLGLVAKILEKDHEGLAYLTHYRTEMSDVVERFYSGKALLSVPDAALERCVTAMSERGVYDIFSGNYDLIRTLALLTLVNSVDLDRQLAVDILKDHGIDLETVLTSIQQHGEPYGFSPVHQGETSRTRALIAVV